MKDAARERSPRRIATAVFITVVAMLAVVVGVWSYTEFGIGEPAAVLVFVLFAVLHVILPDAVVEGRVRVSLSGVILLAGQAVVGPAGVAIVGLAVGAPQGRHVPLRNRVYNAAQCSLHGAAGGIAFLLVGGTTDPARLQDVGDIVVHLALPLLVADVAQALTNLVAIVAVLRVAEGVPMRPQALTMLRGTGFAYIAHGVIAFIMVVLWTLGDLGPYAAVIVLVPLIVAQWVYRQRAEELTGQQRALEVLVAALEAKAPRLAGHSARVAELSAHMAEHLGLGPQQVAETRVAGMLHDLGQTSLPTRTARSIDLTDEAAVLDYPARGAEILHDLSFLDGALDPIRRHREALGTDRQLSLPARIVGVADSFDLLTSVGPPDGHLLAPTQARELLARRTPDGEILRALDHALMRSGQSVRR
ncbi:HD-GYP domain-containing protein [Phycicoccus jejuensis]|uniref:HD-GYP domain-containing protein n=1 Tax=Phycicoccus jejuensis TaxID=367299 RepID=UPI0004C40FF0|nr:HD domain-containing phosphohydrolase [Phycicoccus jejuensis]